jgi:hypothetical protein
MAHAQEVPQEVLPQEPDRRRRRRKQEQEPQEEQPQEQEPAHWRKCPCDRRHGKNQYWILATHNHRKGTER